MLTSSAHLTLAFTRAFSFVHTAQAVAEDRSGTTTRHATTVNLNARAALRAARHGLRVRCGCTLGLAEESAHLRHIASHRVASHGHAESAAARRAHA